MIATSPRSMARLAGLASAGLALGVGELVASTGSTGQSLVGSVGSEVIDRAPAPLVRFGIEQFGTNDKAVLVGTIVVICPHSARSSDR
jgi:hypothetical protein